MRLLLLAAATVAAAIPGCDMPRSRVHGTVKYQGKPVTGGTVIFLTRDNMTYVADLQSDGTYSVTGIPRGPVRVSVQQPPPRPAPRSQTAPKGGWKDAPEALADDKAKRGRQAEAPPADPIPTGPRIPAIYADPGKSGLVFELTQADQQYDIDLK